MIQTQEVKKSRQHGVTSKFRKHICERKKSEKGLERASLLSGESKRDEIRRVTCVKACKSMQKSSKRQRLKLSNAVIL